MIDSAFAIHALTGCKRGYPPIFDATYFIKFWPCPLGDDGPLKLGDAVPNLVQGPVR